jgi:hypothetical protein
VPASLPATAQALPNAELFRNLRMTTPWFSKIIGLVQRTAAIRASSLSMECRKVEVDTMKKLKKADSLKKLW